MFKAKQKLTSIVLACVMMIACLFGAIATLVLPQTTAVAANTEIAFEFGANGSASHSDGSDATSYTETVGGYTLTLTSLSKVYKNARDAKGNSCLKLGTGSAAGKFSFTVPSDVSSVIIAIGKYKSNTAKVTVNGTTTTLTKNSNDGAYDEITVDTSSTKTVSLTTVSGGYRAMVNTITFIVAGSASGCDHNYTEEITKPATCTEDGSSTYTCSVCGDSYNKTISKTGHIKTTETIEEATCSVPGKKTVTCDDCNEIVSETILTVDHNFVDGFCDDCGAEQPLEATISFADKAQRTEYSTTKQVWVQNGITVTNNKKTSQSNVGDYAAPARFYKDSEVIIAYPSMTKIEFTCATKDSTVNNLKNSIDGCSTNGNVVTVTFAEAVDSFTVKLTVGKVFLDSLTVYSKAPSVPEPTTPTTQELVNGVGAYMQLSYQYDTVKDENGAVVALKDSAFRLRFAVDASLANIEGADEYGILITDETGKSKSYNLNDDSFVMTDEEGKYYVVIDLGDTDNNLDRLSLEFTVCAYVKVDGEEEPICSEQIKTHSVASMVNDYYLGNNVAEEKKEEVRAMVEHLYNFLKENGMI